MDRKWYIVLDGQKSGPFTTAQIKAAAAVGQISPDTPILAADEYTDEYSVSENDLQVADALQLQPPPPLVSTSDHTIPDQGQHVEQASEQQAPVRTRLPGKSNASRLERYLELSSHFAYSTVFVLPMVVIYAIGLLYYGFDPNGAHGTLRLVSWLMTRLIGGPLTTLLIIALVGAAVVYMIRELFRKSIRISPFVLPLMLVEVAVLGFVAEIIRDVSFSLSWPTFFSFEPNEVVANQIFFGGLNSPWEIIHACIGAGLCEEFVFRVLLLRLLYFAAEGNDLPFGTDKTALNNAILLSSFLFAVVHVPGLAQFQSAPSLIYSVISLTFMGVLFAAIYVRRGYGIAAGTHAFLDIYMTFGIIG